MDAAPSDDYIRLIQRKNGRIIIRAMLDLEKVTFESIVGKICEDFNIFTGKRKVEKAVRNFLVYAFHLGFIDTKEDQSFHINHSIQEKFEKPEEINKKPAEKRKSSRCPSSCTPTREKRKRNQCPKK